MTQKKRKILFLISVLIFLIAVPVFVEYARGLRFDFKNWQFVETGGLFFRIYSPTETSIHLDNKFTKEMGSLSYFNSAFIQNLIPKDYKIKISRDGFQNWEKTLEVESELVTEAHNIVLLPKDTKLSQISDNNDTIKDFYVSLDGKNMAIIGQNNTKQTFIQIINLDSGQEKKYIASNIPLDLELHNWQINNNKIIFNTKGGGEFIIVDPINEQAGSLYSYLPKQFSSKNISAVSDATRDTLLVLKENILYEVNASIKSFKVIGKNITALRVIGNTVYFVSFDDANNKYSLKRAYYKNNELSQPEMLDDLNFKISKDPVFEIVVIDPDLMYVHEKTDGLLLEYSTKNNFKRVDGEIIAFTISGDQKKILYQKKSEIWVYYRDDVKIQPFKNLGQRELIANIPQEIISSQWYTATDNHIIYSFENSIKFTELDGRSGRNVLHIAELASPKIIYSQNNENLYVLSDKAMFRININQ